MAFVLGSDGRDEDFVAKWRSYMEYVESEAHRFPPGALALARSDWFYNFNDHRCPHDAWLEELIISEPSSGERHENRTVAISMRLFGAYHDGHIHVRYPRVHSYRLAIHDGSDGHRDWRYDEFRVSEHGHLIHEIEWCGYHDSGSWLIEASDIEFVWVPSEV